MDTCEDCVSIFQRFPKVSTAKRITRSCFERTSTEVVDKEPADEEKHESDCCPILNDDLIDIHISMQKSC